eukprot:1599777-Rhodomonas_salina.1
MQAQITAMQAVIEQMQAEAVVAAAAVAAAQQAAADAQAQAAAAAAHPPAPVPPPVDIAALAAAVLAAAPPPAPAPAPPPQADLVAITAAVLAGRAPKDHSRDMDYYPTISLDEQLKAMHADHFLASLKLHFDNKGTPDADCVKMIVPKLSGKALTTFKAFKNVAGDTNNALTTTWVEFVALFERLIPNDLAESLKIENDCDKTFQSGSAYKFVDVYKALVARIRANDESMTLHSDKTLLTKFLKKLKVSVQLHFDSTKLDTLENAYAEAISADSL